MYRKKMMLPSCSFLGSRSRLEQGAIETITCVLHSVLRFEELRVTNSKTYRAQAATLSHSITNVLVVVAIFIWRAP